VIEQYEGNHMMLKAIVTLLSGAGLAVSALSLPAAAEGKAASRLMDLMLYEDRAYGVSFAQYQPRGSATQGVIGMIGTRPAKPLPKPESTVHVRSEGRPGLGPRDGSLARDLATRFCAHHGLTVAAETESQFETTGVWTFRNLCLEEAAVQDS
jgi:hypothetical protein